MLTTVLFALLLADAAEARAVLALAAAQAAQQKPLTVELLPVEPTPVRPSAPTPAVPEARPTRPHGSPVRPLLRGAVQSYLDRTPVVVQGGSSRLEQPLRWQANPRYYQLDLMHGNVQVGAYNTRTKTYHPYDAETGTWGAAEEPPLRLPALRGSVTMPAFAGQSC